MASTTEAINLLAPMSVEQRRELCEYATEIVVTRNAQHAERGSPQWWATAVLTYERTCRETREIAFGAAAKIADEARYDDCDARQIRDRIKGAIGNGQVWLEVSR